MKTSVKKNYIYNLIFQIITLLTPLIVVPYVSRILTVEGVGHFSFINTIASYFVIFADFSFRLYGQREIAKVSEKREKSKILFELLIYRTIFVFTILLLYFVFILTTQLNTTDFNLYLILTILIISVLFDVSFYFQGNENFKIIAIRNVIIKIINVAAIFLFVKRISDLWIYALITALTTFVSNISLVPSLKKSVKKVPINELHPFKHTKKLFLLFIPSLAASIYMILDKSLIGFITHSDAENGYYEQADKVIHMSMTVLSSLGTVMMSRNISEDVIKDSNQFNSNVEKSFQFNFLIGLPMVFGIIAIAQNFSTWFFGEGYEKVPELLMILAPIIFISGLSNIAVFQILLPQQKDVKAVIPNCFGAVVNFIANLFLIYYFQSVGAAIGSLIAEGTVTFVGIWFSRKNIKFSKLIFPFMKYLLFSVIMFIPTFIVSKYLEPSILNTFILIGIGGIIYLLLLLIFKDPLLFNFLQSIKNKIHEKKQHKNN